MRRRGALFSTDPVRERSRPKQAHRTKLNKQTRSDQNLTFNTGFIIPPSPRRILIHLKPMNTPTHNKLSATKPGSWGRRCVSATASRQLEAQQEEATKRRLTRFDNPHQKTLTSTTGFTSQPASPDQSHLKPSKTPNNDHTHSPPSREWGRRLRWSAPAVFDTKLFMWYWTEHWQHVPQRSEIRGAIVQHRRYERKATGVPPHENLIFSTCFQILFHVAFAPLIFWL